MKEVAVRHVDIVEKHDGVYEITIDYGNGYKFVIPECQVTPYPDDLGGQDPSEQMELTVTVLREGDKMRKYYIVDRISGYHDEDDMVYTKIADARAERDRLNAERKAQGSTDDFWMVIDSKGNEVS